MVFFNTNTNVWRPLSIIFFMFMSCFSNAGNIPNLDLNTDYKLRSVPSFHWADTSQTATPTEAKTKLLGGEPTNGYFMVPMTQASHWFAFTLTNTSDSVLKPSIHMKHPRANKVNLHYREQGQWVSQFNGTDIALKQRQVDNIGPAFNLTLDAHESQTFYLEMHTKLKLMRFDIKIGEAKNSASFGDIHFTIINIFIGAGVLITLINSLLYWSFKKRVYLYYSAYLASFIASTFAINSFDLFFNWQLTDRSFLFISYHSMIIFFTLFIGEVLNTKQDMPWVETILKVSRWIAVAIAMATLVDGYYFSATLIAFLPVSVFCLGLTLYATFTGNTSANLLAIGIVMFLTGVTISNLVNLNIIASNGVTDHAHIFGALAEIVMFSIAIFRRVIDLNTNLQSANTALLTISQDAKTLLEQTVSQRTQELYAAKEQAEHAKAKAERANEARGRFLTTLNHEVRTPLNGILGMIEVLQKHQLPSDAKDHLVTLNSASQQLTKLVNNVLDFSKIDHGMLQLRPTRFNLRNLIEQVMGSFKQKAQSKSIIMEVNIDPKLEQYWHGDEHRIQQILINLVGNAVKFTTQGGVYLNVTLHKETFNDTPGRSSCALLFSIVDTGMGIAQTELDCVFDAYHQVSQRPKKNLPGTGLGLAISQQLAHAMGGNISVTSEINQGSQFDLILQLTQASQATDSPKPLLPCIVDTAEMSDKSILIVDDSDINLKVAEAYLQSSGAHLTLFDNGQQALQYFRANRVDIALIDLQMPDIDGLEVSRQMRQIEQLLDGPRCSIVLHTADTRPEIMATASAAGVDQCLFKPYSQSQLMQTLGLSLAITSPSSSSSSSSSSKFKLTHDPILNDLRSDFFQQTNATLQQCAQHIEAHNSEKISADLHKLMGSTSLFGADRLHQTLIEMKGVVNSEKVDHASISQLIRLALEQIQAYQEESEGPLSLS